MATNCSPAPITASTSPAIWCWTSRGRRCCAGSGGGDPDRFKDTYWARFAEQGWYFAGGDGARYGSDGEIWVLGRIDDVMNVSGHRISTAEVESALVGHSGVAEAAVVGATDDHTGQAICAFVILKAHHADMPAEQMVDELRAEVAKEISPDRQTPGKSTSYPNCPKKPAAAKKSCADSCAMWPKDANSATPRPWWIRLCSKRSEPARPESADGGRRDETGAGPVLSGDVAQDRVDRHRHRGGCAAE